MMNNNKLSTLAVLATVFFWGGSGSITKIALREISPSLLVSTRTLLAGVLLLLISKKVYGNISLPKQVHKLLALCGLVGYSIYFLVESYGYSLLTAANGTLILAAIPLFTVIIEVVWMKQSISVNKAFGILVSMLGVALVIGKSISVSGGFNEILGSLFMLGAALSWAVFSILTKGFDSKYPSVLLTAYQMLYGVVFLIPALFLEGISLSALSFGNFQTLGSIMYLALFCSALSCFLFLFALKGMGPSSANVYLNLMPLVGVIVAYFVLGETLSPIQYIGGAIIVTGVFLSNNTKETPKPQIAFEN